MNYLPSSSFISHFNKLKDPRKDNANKRHELTDILLLSLLAIICGAEGWTDIERFGKAKEPFLKEILHLPNGIPSHDTLGDVFAVDVKTLRRSFKPSDKKGAPHRVSAFAAENKTALGQFKLDDKSNEITAIPELLKLLNIENNVVTIDAMGCQKKISGAIIKAKADYVLAIKGNHKTLHEEIKTYLDAPIDRGFKSDLAIYHETNYKNHGRIEQRRYWTTKDISWITELDK